VRPEFLRTAREARISRLPGKELILSVTVKVFLNQDFDCFRRGYAPGDPLVLAASWDELHPRDPGVLLEHVFDQLNVDDPTEGWALVYRANRNRSLSKGDVVVLGETAWSCESVGWKPVGMSDAKVV
jgi:hypothetical protein